MDAHNFGTFIARCRKNKNMTQAQLADRLNITDKAVSRWERGVGLPDISLIIPLASALDISVENIMMTERKEKDMPEFCIYEWILRPYEQKVKLKQEAIDQLSDNIRKQYEDNNGFMFIVNDRDRDHAMLSPARGIEPIPVDWKYVIQKISVDPSVAIEKKDPFREKALAMGGLYAIIIPKEEKVFVYADIQCKGQCFEEPYILLSKRLGTDYIKIRNEMDYAIRMIKSRDVTMKRRETQGIKLRTHLDYCLSLKELDELTAVYRDKVADNVIGYDPTAVIEFMKLLFEKYPEDIAFQDLKNKRIIYSRIGDIMKKCLDVLDTDSNAAETLHIYLERCLTMDELDQFTVLYKDRKIESAVGYELDFVRMFVDELTDKLPV